MEKYFVGNLPADQASKCKLVELNFERKPPSFGVFYLIHPDNGNQAVQKRASSRYPTHVVLRQLEVPLEANKHEATFEESKQIPLKIRLVDFDVVPVIFLDDNHSISAHDNHHHQQQQQAGSLKTSVTTCQVSKKLDAVLLDDRGNLHSLNLTDGSVKCLTSASAAAAAAAAAGKPLRCKLAGAHLVHVLCEKSHFLYGLEDDTLRPISSYLLAPQASKSRFSSLLVCDAMPNVAIAELNDKSLLILHNSNCLAQMKFDQSTNHQLFGSSHSDDELLLITSSLGGKLTAHSIMISDQQQASSTTSGELLLAGALAKDPDRLLPRKPSFECEKCWTFELAEVESLRFLIDLDEPELLSISMCPIWSTKQQNQPHCWPKFLLLTVKFHLILLSFAQEPVQPFSVIYDRNFLKVTPMTVTGGDHYTGNDSQQQQQQQAQDEQEFIDVKTEPKLVGNFKIIGPKPNDSLFNTLFLVKRGLTTSPMVVNCRHFAQLALVVCVLNTGELIAFRWLPSEQECEPVYQKLVADSLRSSSALLANQIGWLVDTNKRLAAMLESRKATGSNEAHSVVAVDLEPSEREANLYELSLHLVCPELIDQVIVVSSVPGSRIISSPSSGVDLTHVNEDDDAASVLISLDEQADLVPNQVVLVQISFPDCPTGSIDVFTTIRTPDEVTPIDSDPDDHTGEFYLNSIKIRPLLAYRRLEPASSKPTDEPEMAMFEVRGEFTTQTLNAWLSELFSYGVFELADSRLQLESPLTCQFMQFHLQDGGILQVSGNDRVAMELVRKTIMRRATDASLRLEMVSVAGNLNSPPPAGGVSKQSVNGLAPKAPTCGSDTKQLEEMLLATIMNECHEQSEFWSPELLGGGWLSSELRQEIQLAASKTFGANETKLPT